VRLGPARPDGSRAGVLGPGELLGEGSFLGQTPRPSRAEVVEDTRLIQVNDRTLEAVVRHGPQTARAIFEQLLALARSAGDELSRWTIGQLLHRVAPNLTVAGGGVLPEDLAESSGLDLSEVLQVLEELRRRGGLVREGPRYRAPDLGLLQREIDGFAAASEPA
jgi:CRP-like cAMP-binding protein